MNFESKNLDILRAFAVLCVYVSHLPMLPPYISFIGIHELGICGVLFFFVHTSLVLLLSLERTKSRWYFLDFYVRRVFRIYPLSSLCIAVVVLFHIADPGKQYQWIGVTGLIANLALVQNLTHSDNLIGPLWSLPYEMQMYLLLPVLYWLLRWRFQVQMILAMWVVCVAAGMMFVAKGFVVYPAFFLGGVLAYQRAKTVRAILPSVFWVPAIFAVLILRGALLHDGNIMLPNHILVNATACLILGLIIPIFRQPSASWLTSASHYMAKYSYGLYLFHVPVMWLVFVKLAFFPALLRWALLLILSVVIPVLAYHFLEHPMIAYGKAVARHWSQPLRAATVAYVTAAAAPLSAAENPQPNQAD